MPKNKSPTTPNLWMQSAMTGIQQPTPATIAMVTHQLHLLKTAPAACNSTQPAEQTAQHGIPIAPNATRWDTGDQNGVVASHFSRGMHLHQEMHLQLGHHRWSPDAHLGTTTATLHGVANKTDAIDVSEDHSPQHEIAIHSIQPNMTTVATPCATGNTKGAPTHNELLINAINHSSVRNTHPKEIIVEVHAPWCNEAYTTIQLPASASRKGTASLHIKGNTRAGGNILPLCIFRQLYPNQISPGGLDHVSTRLTAYNGSHIPLYGILCGPITWQPDLPGAQPHRVNSYWYVTDTPGPAILGLPSSEKLAVVKMNCAITVMWPGTKSPHPAPASTAATNKPATVPTAAKSIRTTDDLIKEFPDWFTGIGRFPGEYNIWLHHNVHPMIHAPRKCPIALHLKVKEHLNKIECLGMITHVDEPMDWVSSITHVQKANGKLHLCLDPCDLNEAICHDHHKMPTMEEVAHEFAHSCFFTKMDAHHGYWSIILN